MRNYDLSVRGREERGCLRADLEIGGRGAARLQCAPRDGADRAAAPGPEADRAGAAERRRSSRRGSSSAISMSGPPGWRRGFCGRTWRAPTCARTAAVADLSGGAAVPAPGPHLLRPGAAPGEAHAVPDAEGAGGVGPFAADRRISWERGKRADAEAARTKRKWFQVTRFTALFTTGMHGTEHCNQERRALRLSAPR